MGREKGKSVRAVGWEGGWRDGPYTVLCSLSLGQHQEESGGIFNFESGNA